MLEQMQKTNRAAVSTVKLLGLGNANNKETYLATSNNWTSIRPQLVNYTTQELARLVSYLNATNTLILPKDAAISIGQWTGVGYVASGDEIQSMMITGGYNGGYSIYLGMVQSGSVQNQTTVVYMQLPPANISRPQSIEPVDLATGDYLFESVDLTLGDKNPWVSVLSGITIRDKSVETVLCGMAGRTIMTFVRQPTATPILHRGDVGPRMRLPLRYTA